MILSLNLKTRPNKEGVILLNGGGVIRGKVSKLGVGYLAKVRLYNRDSGALIAKAMSTNLGYYSFNLLNKKMQFMVVGIDMAKEYNAVIQDMVVPK